MKKYYILLPVFIIMLCGCSTENDKNSDVVSTSITQTDNFENTLTETCDISGEHFTGLKDAGEMPYICNSVSCLNRNGILYNSGELIYSDLNGSLKRNDTVICHNVFPECINVLNGIVYFISRNDNKVYSYDLNGNELKVFLDTDASLFIKTDKYSFIEDCQNKLYLITENSAKPISDKTVTWTDIYGKYVICCEFENGCRINAYDTENGDVIKLLDYGFFPLIHGDMLYYQEKDNGYICSLDLTDGKISTVLKKWGQQFSFIDDELYYTDSRGIHSAHNTDVYIPDSDSEIQTLFESGNELFFTEYSKQTSSSKIYRLDILSGEKVLIE